MPRRHLSIREDELAAYHERLLKTPAVSAFEKRKAAYVRRQEVKRSDGAATMRRLERSFVSRRDAVRRAKAIGDHDKPECDHPNCSEWKSALASTDFVAFVCDLLLIDVADYTPSLEVTRWMEKLRLVTTAEKNLPKGKPVTLESLYSGCIKAAIDERTQKRRANNSKR